MAASAPLSALQYLAAALVMTVGASIQGAVGFGSNLFAAPLLVLIDPALVPAPAILASFVLNLLVATREHGRHAWREIRIPVVAQVPGAIAGAAVLSVLPKDDIAIFFAVMILLAVGLSASGLHPRRTPRNLVAAGGASGFMGTSVGIGGPPIALLYQHAEGHEIRAALSRFFGVGGLVSLAMLAAFGQFHLDDLGRALALLPGTLIGYFVSSRLLAHVDRSHVRAAVLGLSALSATAALFRAIVG